MQPQLLTRRNQPKSHLIQNLWPIPMHLFNKSYNRLFPLTQFWKYYVVVHFVIKQYFRSFSVTSIFYSNIGLVFFQKISILLPWRVFGLNPHPSGNSSLGSYFPLKIVAFKTSLPLGISNDPLWWGYYF